MDDLKPYMKLAEIYDQLMDHVDYDYWSNYILKLIHLTGKKVDTVIDISCGTGNLINHLQEKISILYGCDNSKEMIFKAKKKKSKNSKYLFINDIRNMAIRESCFDCALLLYDSLNYLIDDISLDNALKEINRILKKGGIFIFDVVSENHCIKYFGDFHESEYWNNSGYSRHSYYDPLNRYQFNEFRIVIKGETFFEKHQQKIYNIEYLKTVLESKAFKIIGTYDDFSEQGSDQNFGRIHFLCTKL